MSFATGQELICHRTLFVYEQGKTCLMSQTEAGNELQNLAHQDAQLSAA